ncbi:glycogen/starch/alpha-glucan phosphorylase [Vallitalea sp.]|uniref:glycogen/starch/alpha-glucan phosphorylase n=1 Tax=Vallitalea sp. TaxID=1882829 RepID=UPI0025D3AAC0|nr:glycogen/starch/alpha-glucan phosphorylase [Vallitalea sp.]MCT4688003.1 glycogen/starch/alpha-glucan phosphorylase [Vallitalea sp.]
MNRLDVTVEELKEAVLENIKNQFRKTIEQASKEQIFTALAFAVRDIIIDQWIKTHITYDEKDPKTVYYLSMEFLMGRALGNNIINMKVDDVVKKVCDELELDLNVIEDMEPDPGLGNGGLGRLAACFLDSLSTLEYPAYGCGIRYRYGIFEQKIIDGYQVERPDEWLKNGNPFEVRRDEYGVEVKFLGSVRVLKTANGRDKFVQENYQSVKAIPYDIPIVGYDNNTVNTLRLWDAEAIVGFDLESFDRGEYHKAVEQQNLAKSIVEVLYPNDNHYMGKELRLKQQYFFISATVQQVINKFKQKHKDIRELPEKIAFHINDTHPSLTIPELMRVLLDEEELEWEEAWDITTKTCAYTNHTIMSEALEKWPIELLSRLLPRIYMIIEEINRRFCLKLVDEFHLNKERIHNMSIIMDGQIKMAWMCIVGSHSVNGVAMLHTKILKNEELKDFYEIYPDKFNNKTNGITQRRFLLEANSKLADFVTGLIGDKWITYLPHIKKLEEYVDSEQEQKEFMKIKYENKMRLAEYIKEHNNIEIDPRSIFDVQIKRLHEYKRQLMNILHIMHLYNKLLENPEIDMIPRTFIFGAKAAPGYSRAKLIIKLINNVADVINNDINIKNKIKVVFIENYNVSNAEIIIAAADVSEQISTASKEASGTGNMKLMLNGAVTLGTMDGANIEIVEEVGRDNCFIFGLSSEEVIKLQQYDSYNPWDLYNNNADIRKVVTQLINGFYAPDDPDLFREIYDSLLNGDGGRPDPYFILKDFDSYQEAHKKIDIAYANQRQWAKMVMLNTANSGKFSSDRTIEQYAKEIWDLEKTTVVMKTN